MKKLILALLIGELVASAVAQDKSRNTVPKYDPATESTLNGTVQEIKDFDCNFSRGVESHLELKMADGSVVEIHLAPVKFMKQYEIVITSGPVEVVGSKVTYQNSQTVLARKVSQGGNTYEFRDPHGKPYW